jgi:peptidoglycan hydrolase-like protein with peptidoglycan-binding domain
MQYCEICGEPVEGRFCRMCGAPAGAGGAATQTSAAVPAQSRGYGAAQGVPAAADPMTATFAGAVPAHYGAEPTQMLGATAAPASTQMLGATATPADFDAYFRSEDGSPGLHGQTQLLAPVVDDYQVRPPHDGVHAPAGGSGGRGADAYPDEPRSNRPVIFVTLGAVAAVAAVILVLLYLGNQATNSNTASGASSTATAGSTVAPQGGGVIQVPTDGASLAPTTAAPSTGAAAPAAAQFQGDSLPLGPGSSGSWVKWVQEQLSVLGYYQGAASGNFDQATASAVQRFQAAANVTGDAAGTVGMHTIVALASAGSTPSLHVGSRSASVSRLNTALSLATGEHLSGSRYTMSTAAAVMRYQASVGLTPTGQADAATWAKLQDGTLAAG